MNENLKEKLKFNIAISQMKEEEKVAMKNKKIKLKKGVGIAACFVIATTGVVFAKDIDNYVKKIFGANASDGVQIAVDNNYIQKVEPTYVNSEGIEIAVDSFLIDDYNFDMDFKIKLSDQYDAKNMQSMNFQDLKVVDENNEIVFATGEYQEEIAREKNKSDETFEPLFWGGYGMCADVTGENELTFHLTAHGSEEHKIPKSKKLYVTFSKIQIRKDYYENILNTIYTGDWKFELDVPEEMYNRETVIYKMKSCSEEKIKVGDATVSNTAFKISVPELDTDKVDYALLHVSPPKSIYDMMALQKEYVETSDGKRFEPSHRSDGDGGYGLPQGENKIINYTQTFNLTKYDATDILKVHIFTNKGEEIIIEYERSK